MVWNLTKISKHTQEVNSALHHVESVNRIHTGLKDQMRVAMDYFVSGDLKERSAQNALSLTTKASLNEWVTVEEARLADQKVTMQNYMGKEISDKYDEATSMISDSVALMDAGKKDEAIKLLGEDVERYVDIVLLPDIDRAVNDEVELVKNAFDELYMSMGSMPWVGGRELRELSNTKAAFGYFLSVNDINTNLQREIQEATFFVATGGEEESRQFVEYGVNVTRAIDDLIYQLSVHTLDGVEGEDDDLQLAKTIMYTQYELLAMFRKAHLLREAGKVGEGNLVLNKEVKPLAKNVIFPAIAELMEDSREEVEEMSSRLSRLMFNAAVKGALLLLVVTGSVVFLSVWVTRGIITSLNKLSKGAKSIGEGGLTHRIELKSRDEFRDLANHFNEMVENLQQTTVSRDLLSKEVEERKRSEEQISHMAYYDQLTGLPNRALLLDRIDQALIMAQRQSTIFAVLFFDLDRFKIINDTLGHTMGDEVLKNVANRLTGYLRKSDTLARQGGDEFTVVAQNIKSIKDISKIAENIFSAFKGPFNINGQKFSISVSMGISIYPNDGVDADTLIKNADIALYKSKDEGRNSYCFYNSTMDEGIAKRLTLGNKLCQAIEKDEFLIHYQPQVNTATGEIFGLEALVRWQEPEGELISPGEFIPVAEDTGLIIPLGEWVLREACRQNKKWQDAGLNEVTVSVNISMLQFKQKEFVDKVKTILDETGLAPKYLELELTESIVMKDVDSTLKILHELKSMGLRLSIDDFGTGYSSLEYLKRMPIDMLKIDQSFMKDITVSPDDIVIAKAIIQMAHNLQMDIIAEGVESREQLELLNTLKCNRVQGYLFSRALLCDDVTGLLKKGWRFVVESLDPVEYKKTKKSA